MKQIRKAYILILHVKAKEKTIKFSKSVRSWETLFVDPRHQDGKSLSKTKDTMQWDAERWGNQLAHEISDSRLDQ